ncbi:MAG TPA: L,D-transpeptidase family protein [Chitinophagaceae bacterium]|nr:L,D-transpeptidase family protein [Chitinophagaceae bacterium]
MNAQMKNLVVMAVLCGIGLAAPAQTSVSAYSSFIDYQKTFQRPSEALLRKEDTLRKQFAAKKLQWPAHYIYIRSFKYDSQLEVWVKNQINEPFQLFKTYKVCALAGSLGPKRMEGDFQVPEGFYYINEFNPRSDYYLSLGINYPNASDRILGDAYKPGAGIYIHGSCVTVGCIPLTDNQIDEVYILAAHAKDLGQDYIPVHIFPIRFNVKKSQDYLGSLTRDDAELRKFAGQLQDAFDYFEKYHQLPVVMTTDRGDYVVDDAPSRKPPVKATTEVRTEAPKHRTRDISYLAESVHQWPRYPGGGEAFMKYLELLGREMADYLPTGITRAYVQVEFVVDKDGVPVNFRVIRGGNPEYNDELITRLEKMPAWQPALLNDKPVAKKMVQTITLGAY